MKSLITVLARAIFPKWVPIFFAVFLIRKFLDKLTENKIMKGNTFRDLSRALSKKVDPTTVTAEHIPSIFQKDLITAALVDEFPGLPSYLGFDETQMLMASAVLNDAPYFIGTDIRLAAVVRDQEEALEDLQYMAKHIENKVKGVLAFLKMKHHISVKDKEIADGTDFRPVVLDGIKKRWVMRTQYNMNVKRAIGFGSEYTTVNALNHLYELPHTKGGTSRVLRTGSGTVYLFYIPVKTGFRSSGTIVLWTRVPNSGITSKVGRSKQEGVYPVKIYVEQNLPTQGFIPALFPNMSKKNEEVKILLGKMLHSYVTKGTFAVQTLQTQSDMDLMTEAVRALAPGWNALVDQSGSRALLLEMDLLTGGFAHFVKRFQLGWKIVNTETGHIRHVSDKVLEQFQDKEEEEILSLAEEAWEERMEKWIMAGSQGKKPNKREIEKKLYEQSPYEYTENFEYEVPHPELALNVIVKSIGSLSPFHKDLLERFDVAIRVREYRPTEVNRSQASMAYILIVPNEVGFGGMPSSLKKKVAKKVKGEGTVQRKRTLDTGVVETKVIKTRKTKAKRTRSLDAKGTVKSKAGRPKGFRNTKGR